MTDVKPCCNGWFGAHRFEARFDLSAADLSPFQSFTTHSATDTSSVIEGMRARTYVRDVCVKCGAVIERAKAEGK